MLILLLKVVAVAAPAAAPDVSATPAPVVGVLCNRLLPENLRNEERGTLYAPLAPDVPSGLCWATSALGQGLGARGGMKLCDTCKKKPGHGASVQCTTRHKGKGKAVPDFSTANYIWKAWYTCRSLPWRPHLPVQNPKGWALMPPPGA